VEDWAIQRAVQQPPEREPMMLQWVALASASWQR
jgi:hypothetical protein